MGVNSNLSADKSIINPYMDKTCHSSTLRLDFEQRRLEYLKLTLQKINDSLYIPQQNVSLIANRQSKLKHILRKLLYYFLAGFGSVQNSVGVYLFARHVFSLIPGILNPVIMALSLCFTAIDAVIFYIFDISSIKDSIGLSKKEKDVKSVIAVLIEQLKIINDINKLLLETDAIDITANDYKKFVDDARLFNQDVVSRLKTINDVPKSMPRKILSIGVIIFGLLSNIAGSYFLISGFCAATGIGLMGTPIGWVVISLAIMATVGIYFATGAKSKFHRLIPEYKLLDDFMDKAGAFKVKSDGDFDKINNLRKLQAVCSIKDENKETDIESHLHERGNRFFAANKSRSRANSCPVVSQSFNYR